MKPGTKGKKVCIVIEETAEANGFGFKCYVTGIDRKLTNVPQEEMTPGEFWGMAAMSATVKLLRESGVIKSEIPIERGEGLVQ